MNNRITDELKDDPEALHDHLCEGRYLITDQAAEIEDLKAEIEALKEENKRLLIHSF